jgi:5'-nucleotidase
LNRFRIAAVGAALAGALAIAPATMAKPSSAPGQAKADFRLTLLHNNDGESKLLTGDSITGFGGAARFATVVERLRAEAADALSRMPGADKKQGRTLLVSSGDNFLASNALRASFEKGIPWYDSLVLNRLGYDAVTLGNHEFDFGQTRLADFVEGTDSDIPFLSANLGWEGTDPRLQALVESGRITDRAVVGKGKERVGVIGLTTPDIRSISSPGNVQIRQDIAAVVQEQVRALRASGVNKIVVSAHLQSLVNDRELIPQVRGVDVWIAGGGDELLADGDDVLIPGDAAQGTYPLEVDDAKGREVLLVSTAGEYKYVGRLTVDFDKLGRVIGSRAAQSGPVRVSGRTQDPDYAPEDPVLLETVVQPVTQFIAGLASTILGTSEVDLKRTLPGLTGTNDPVRRRESTFGNLIADGYLYLASKRAPLTGAPVPQVALGNSGGIRDDIPIDDLNGAQISRADVLDALSFTNQLVTVPNVTCDQLRQLLERGFASLPAIAGNFPIISGMRVVVDPTRQAQVVTGSGASITTPGQRVRQLSLTNGTPIVVDGAVVPNCQPVALASIDFLVNNGGDSYPFPALGLSGTGIQLGVLYSQTLEDYLTDPTSEGGLGGLVTDEQYPQPPATGAGARITILGD